MPFRVPKPFRQNRALRVAAGACVLAVAFLVQYRLMNFPMPVDIGANGKFSPASVRPEQELVIEGPSVSSPEGVLLWHDGDANEIVNVRFDSARLDELTLEDLSNPRFQPPAGAVKIDYFTSELEQTPEAREQCRTFLKIRPKHGKPPSALHLYQVEGAGADRHRHLEVKTGDAELAVEMVTDAPPGVRGETQGCRKSLRVGGLPGLSLPASTTVTVVAAPGSSFRFSFQPLDQSEPLWEGGREGFFAPFELGPPSVNPNDPARFRARAASVRKRQDDGSPPLLTARSVEGKELSVYGMEVGSDELRVRVSGSGSLSVNGKDETVDMLERVQKHPIPAGILAGVNTALLAWFVSLLAVKKRTARRKMKTTA